MVTLKVVTINILDDLSRWHARRSLLAQGLRELKPDIVALQEVRLPQNPARWLAEQLGLDYLYLTPKMGFESSREAIGILSRLPFVSQGMLDLQGQNRVAQCVEIRVDGCAWRIANGHFYWQPGESQVRQMQIEALLRWLQSLPGDLPCIVCGDFNSTPEQASMQRMRQHFVSAYAAIHGGEPDYTCPTPLPRSFRSQLRTWLGFFLLRRSKELNLKWRGVLDYIYADPRIKILDCQVVLDKPDPQHPKIYPSDHFGLCAVFETSLS